MDTSLFSLTVLCDRQTKNRKAIIPLKPKGQLDKILSHASPPSLFLKFYFLST